MPATPFQTARGLNPNAITITSIGTVTIPAGEFARLDNLVQAGVLGQIADVQSFYCNASGAVSPITFLNPKTGQEIVFPPGKVGWLNFLVTSDAAQILVFCAIETDVILAVTSAILSQYLVDANTFGGSPSSRRVDVNASASAVTLLDENTARNNYTLWNDSVAILYVLHDDSTPTSTNFSFYLGPQEYYELSPQEYGGVVKGIWSVATGGARLTEYT